jgi:hypothetical protein
MQQLRALLARRAPLRFAVSRASAPLACLLLVGCSFDGVFGTSAAAADHDGDGVRDDLDVCPHLRDPQQPDGDDDGVGDACDPDNAVAHRLVLFDGFENAPSPELWDGGSSFNDWTVARIGGNSYWRQNSVANAQRQLLLREALTAASVQTRFFVDLAAESDRDRYAGVLLDGTSATPSPDYASCAVRRDKTTGVAWAHAGFFQSDALATGDDEAWTEGFLSVAVTARGAVTPSGGGKSRLQCELSGETAMGAPTVMAAGDGSGRVGLRTWAAAAAFDYIFIVAPL